MSNIYVLIHNHLYSGPLYCGIFDYDNGRKAATKLADEIKNQMQTINDERNRFDKLPLKEVKIEIRRDDIYSFILDVGGSIICLKLEVLNNAKQ
jgi:hypothetical protein